MTTLRIEHAITDYQLWKKAFDGFAEARAQAGVRSIAIRLPVDDPQYLMLDLEFDSPEPAQTFADFLRHHQRLHPAWPARRRLGSSTSCPPANADYRAPAQSLRGGPEVSPAWWAQLCVSARYARRGTALPRWPRCARAH
jgi:hypothetical protein